MISMAGVKVRESESFENALRRFKRITERAGILSDLKKHQRYEKPSEKKKKKLLNSMRKTKKPRTTSQDY